MIKAVSFSWLLIVVIHLIISIVNANWITGNLCWSMPCLNGGSCFGSAYTYLCVCPINFSGALCEKKLGICQESPCGNRGLCVETGLTSFECRCYFDYMGPLCEEHVPKNDPSVWSSLIPVHTRVLFDILQEAYRAKVHGKSPAAANPTHVDAFDLSIPPDTALAIPPSSMVTTTLGTTTSTMSSSSTETMQITESPHVIRADHIQLEKIFPEITTVPTPPTDLLSSTSSIVETTMLNELINETMGSSTWTNTFTETSEAITTENPTTNTPPVPTTATIADNLSSTVTVEPNQTFLSSTLDDQDFTNATETLTTIVTMPFTAWSTDNISNETMDYTTQSIISTTPNMTETINNHTDADQVIFNTTVSMVNDNPTTSNKITTDYPSSSETHHMQYNSTEEPVTTMAMTTESSLVIEGLLRALNSSETLRNRLLYKLCRQLLSHILPNASSSSSAAATATALNLVSNSSAAMNRTADALLSWIQEQLTSSMTTNPTTTTSTMMITTTTTPDEISSSSTAPDSPSLSLKENQFSSMSLQRMNMDDVLAQLNNNIDGDPLL